MKTNYPQVWPRIMQANSKLTAEMTRPKVREFAKGSAKRNEITGTGKKIMRIHLKTQFRSRNAIWLENRNSENQITCGNVFSTICLPQFFATLYLRVFFASFLLSWPPSSACWMLLSQECDYFVCIGFNGYAMKISMG